MYRLWLFGAAVGAALLIGGGSVLGSPAAAGGSGASGAAAPARAGAPTTCGVVEVISPTNTGPGANYLYGVTALSATDTWAVGKYNLAGNIYAQAQHWNGTAWTDGGALNLSATANTLQGVTATAPNSVWAVGSLSEAGTTHTLVEYWNGSTWTRQTSANTRDAAYLTGVSMVGPSDGWAVGSSLSTSAGIIYYPLIEHWNGSSWDIVTSPNVPSSNYTTLTTVAAVSSTDVWAVGYGYVSGVYQTLVEHWDGGQWTIIASPNVGTHGSALNAISVVAANDIWATGYYMTAGNIEQTLILHWNGGSWSVVGSPNVGTHDNSLLAVAAVSSTDVWAAGWYNNDSLVAQTLVAHWDGGNWSVVTSPNPGYGNRLVNSAAATAGGEVWMVGIQNNGATNATMGLHYGPCAPPTPTATLTPTETLTPTVAPTEPPTATPTVAACGINFSDVADPSAYYYGPVYYLACRGVVGGYSDGTYRPFNNTTRGQMSKIVVLAYNLPIQTPAAGEHTFADTAPGSTFFDYVETAAGRAIIGGYACGGSNPQTGAAEPCDGASRPYYRGGNFVTRGQLTKIVVGAAVQIQSWVLLNPPTATFSDVPSGSTFYQYVETAVCHQVLNGYADGTFRPSNNATRGQIAKIVTNAVTITTTGCTGLTTP